MCCKPQGGGGEVGGAQPQPIPRAVAASDCARWKALCRAAIDLSNAGKYAEARSSVEHVVAEVVGALGKEAEELVEPLRVLAMAHLTSSHHGDACNVMMRAMTLSEKHHGEEGLDTCELRS